MIGEFLDFSVGTELPGTAIRTMARRAVMIGIALTAAVRVRIALTRSTRVGIALLRTIMVGSAVTVSTMIVRPGMTRIKSAAAGIRPKVPMRAPISRLLEQGIDFSFERGKALKHDSHLVAGPFLVRG